MPVADWLFSVDEKPNYSLYEEQQQKKDKFGYMMDAIIIPSY